MKISVMAQPRIIAGSLLLSLVAVTMLLLTACQDTRPDPEPVPTATRAPATPEPNFAFLFEWNFCYSYVLDTFENDLTVLTNSEPPVTTTIDFALSSQELLTIYHKMEDIDFFSYPEKFSILLPSHVIRVYTGHTTHYRFDVRNGSQRKTLSWDDQFSEPRDMPWKPEESEPYRTQAIRLRELITQILDIVTAYPQFQSLPSGGCA
jgi:hypothetical protein